MPEKRDYSYLWAWEPLQPSDIAQLLVGFRRPWWICGGWAIDLFLNRETRRHDDLDVAVLRQDQLELHRHLKGWDLRYATPQHTLEHWDGRRLDPPIHGIWARRSNEVTAPWTCEFLLNEERRGQWLFGRDQALTRSLDLVGLERDGVPFLRPEIVLLYKANDRSPKNDADFAAVRPHLSRAERLWLCSALETNDARHPWVSPLSRGESRLA